MLTHFNAYYSFGRFINMTGGGQEQDTHPGQCLHSPRLYWEPDDCASSSAAEEPVLQTEPQNPTAEQSHKEINGKTRKSHGKFECVLFSGALPTDNKMQHLHSTFN